MPKRRTIASIDAQMREVKQKMTAVKQRYDRLCDDLATLQAERDSLMAHEIVEAMKRSGKSYDELMTFLKAS